MSSASSRAGWESRWDDLIERGEIDKLGPKGMAYYLENYAGDEVDDYFYDWEDFEIDQWEEEDSPA